MMDSLKLCVLLLIIFFSKFIRAAEDNLYDFLWLDPDKSVYVLQHKVYEKNHSFYFDLNYLSNGSSEFQSSRGGSGTLGYFFKEEWAVELSYATYSNSDNAAYQNVTQINGTEPFVRRANSLMGMNLIWSPFYGKINTFNKIIYFDWSFGLGIGTLSMESNINTVTNPKLLTVYSKEDYSSLVFKSDIKVYINRRFHLQVGVQDAIYRAPGPRDKAVDTTRHNIDLSIGIGISF